MTYYGVVLSVSDIHASRQFYEDLFGLEVDHDYGINICFTGGLSLQQEFHWLVGLPKDKVLARAGNAEICFEEEDFDGFLDKLRRIPAIETLGDVIEHGWGQRVIRFYDPDGHIIEVGENLGMVVRRFLASGMSMEEIAIRMDVSLDDLDKLLKN